MRRSLPPCSLRPESQQEDPPTPTSFTWSSFRWFYVCCAALLCLPFFFQIFDFKLYGALLSGMMVAVQLCVHISFILEQVALRIRTTATAWRTLSSVAWGELEYTEELDSNPSSYFPGSLGSFALSEQELTLISQLCSKRELQ